MKNVISRRSFLKAAGIIGAYTQVKKEILP